jgi:hypothetical protein
MLFHFYKIWPVQKLHMFLYIYTQLKDYRESATGVVPIPEVCMTDTLVLLMVCGVTSSVR